MKAIIFDLDGVIVSTDKYHYQAWKKIADELGLVFNQGINNRLRGVGRIESLNIILENYDAPLTEDEKVVLAEGKNTYYRNLLNEMTPGDLDPEVLETLIELRNRGYLLAIGSSSKNAPFILSKLGLDGFFDAISDGNNVIHSKPDPEVFLKASEYLGEMPEACWVVEDAVAGIQAAQAANMPAIAIGDARKSDIAAHSIERFSQLLNILK